MPQTIRPRASVGSSPADSTRQSASRRLSEREDVVELSARVDLADAGQRIAHAAVTPASTTSSG